MDGPGDSHTKRSKSEKQIPWYHLCGTELSHSVVSDFLWPHEPQHARLPCPSSTPRVYSNSCPLSWWYCPTISSSVVPFSSCPQSFPASFQKSQLFASGREMQIKTTMRYSFIVVRMSIIKNDKLWRGCGEKGIFQHCWWECKLVQPLYRTEWRIL